MIRHTRACPRVCVQYTNHVPRFHPVAPARSFSIYASPLRQSSSQLISHPSFRNKPVQRLFISGLNPFLPPTVRNASTPSFVEVPLATWLGSLGVKMDASGEELEIMHVASGLGHHMVGYRHKGTENIFAIGRNESGQLGIGYNSQEPTRGLVENFSGDFVQDIKCGITSSYIQVKQGDESVLYTCGNHARGQIGFAPARTDGERPSQAFSSRATLVPLPAGVSVKQLATGFEHALVLSVDGKLYGTGINTDGQLGTGDDLDRHSFSEISLPPQLSGEEGGIERIEACADTSALLAEQGNLYTFGNSEYAQAFHGEKIDRILEPRLVDLSFLDSHKIASFKIGGSFSLLLDDRGLVYAAGFGAIGQGENSLEAIKPTRIPGLEGITAIYAGHGYAAAVNDRQQLFMLGLNTPSGRLGISNPPINAYEPLQAVMSVSRSVYDGQMDGCRILNVTMSGQTTFVLVEDNNNRP